MNFIYKIDITIYYVLLLYALASSISIAVANIAISLATLLAIVRHIKEPLAMNIDKGLVKAIGVFLLAVFISAIFAYKPIVGFDRLWAYTYRMFPLILAMMFIRNKEQMIKVLIIMGASIFIADSYAIWQGVHGNYRANAFSGHYMVLAGCLIQMIPLLLIVGLENEFISTNIKIYFISTVLISGIALIYNGTRGAWIAVLVALLVYSMINIKENKKIGIGVLTVCLIGGILAVNMPVVKDRALSIVNYRSNSDDRIPLWISSWHMFKDHPLVGVGPNNFAVVYQSNYILPEAKEPDLGHAHNNFIQMLAETGIIGLSSFVYMFGYILLTMYRRYMIHRQNIWSLVAFIVTISLLVQGLTEYNFGNSAVIRMYWFILGLMYAASNIDSKSTE